MPKDESTEIGIVDDFQDDVSFEQPEQTATTEEEMSDYQRATVSEETSTDDEKPPAEKKEDPPEDDVVEETDEQPAETSTGDKEKSKPKGDVPIGVQKRIGKITKEKYEERRQRENAERERDELRQRVAELEAGKGLAELDKAEPVRDDFEEDTEYYKAMASWSAKREIAEDKIKSVPKATAPTAANEKASQEEIDMVLSMGRQAYGSEFDKAVFNPETFLPDFIIKEACKTDIPHEVIFEISQNKSLSENLRRMNSFGLAEEITRIAGTLSGTPKEHIAAPNPKKPLTKKISNAPAPIQPRTGTHSVSEKSLEDLSHAEYRKKRGLTR